MATFEPMMPPCKAAWPVSHPARCWWSSTVTERGTVSNIRIVKEEPAAMTSARRRQTIAKWTFKPAMVDGKPQASRMQQEIEFATN